MTTACVQLTGQDIPSMLNVTVLSSPGAVGAVEVVGAVAAGAVAPEVLPASCFVERRFMAAKQISTMANAPRSNRILFMVDSPKRQFSRNREGNQVVVYCVLSMAFTMRFG